MPEDSAPSPKIFISGVSKSFGAFRALANCSLRVGKGEVLALIGPNGAGKTTLIKILTGLLEPTSGCAALAGHDIQADPIGAKRTFGYVPDDPTVYDYLTGREFLALTGRLRGLSRSQITERTTDLLGLFPVKHLMDEQMGNYSRGNKQKVAFLAALLPKPDMLLIDEPIVGLDPESITILGKTIREFAKNGGTVLFTTHILSFAKDYADAYALMVGGKIVRKGRITTQTTLDGEYKKAVQ